MAYTSLTRQSSNLTKKGDATRDRSRDNMKGTVQYMVTYAYTNNNCLLSTSNVIVSVAIHKRLCGISVELSANIEFIVERLSRRRRWRRRRILCRSIPSVSTSAAGFALWRQWSVTDQRCRPH